MEDIAPALLEMLQTAFHDNLAADTKGVELLAKIASGGTYADASDYAEIVGDALTKAFRENLSSAVLPDGRMYWNIADRVVRPLLGEDYALVAEQAAIVQQSINTAAGIGLKAQTAKLDKDRVDGILNRLDSEINFDDVSWILQEPVKVLTRTAVDDTVLENAKFQYGAGLSPKISRTSRHKCCEWCNSLVGSYDYSHGMLRDVYKRHDNCRCLVEFVEGNRRDTIHSGSEGKRRYINNGYDRYDMTTEARKQRAEERVKNEAERKSAARQKRIDTWARKRELANAEKSAKIEYRKSDNVMFSLRGKPNYARGVPFVIDDEGFIRNITPEAIVEDLKTSPIGSNMLKYMRDNQIYPQLIYEKQPPYITQRGDQYGRQIRIFISNNSNARQAAQTIIHELTHQRYNIGGCVWAEAHCFAAEKMHIEKRNWLTFEEKKYIVRLAKTNYANLRWRVKI